jgi:hypothetical protein
MSAAWVDHHSNIPAPTNPTFTCLMPRYQRRYPTSTSGILPVVVVASFHSPLAARLFPSGSQIVGILYAIITSVCTREAKQSDPSLTTLEMPTRAALNVGHREFNSFLSSRRSVLHALVSCTILYLSQMDAPMSEWFHSIPVALDTVAFAAKARAHFIVTVTLT